MPSGSSGSSSLAGRYVEIEGEGAMSGDAFLLHAAEPHRAIEFGCIRGV